MNRVTDPYIDSLKTELEIENLYQKLDKLELDPNTDFATLSDLLMEIETLENKLEREMGKDGIVKDLVLEYPRFAKTMQTLGLAVSGIFIVGLVHFLSHFLGLVDDLSVTFILWDTNSLIQLNQ